MSKHVEPESLKSKSLKVTPRDPKPLESWHKYLDSQGAVWHDGTITHFKTQTAGEYTSVNKLIIANHLAYILVSGTESIKFLQGQVTCDMQTLSSEHSVIGAHCNLKGRMVFSFHAILLTSDDSSTKVALIMHRELIETAMFALKKFAVFSKVDISQSEDYQLLALTGPQLDDISAINIDSTNTDSAIDLQLPMDIKQCKNNDGSIAIKLSDDRILFFMATKNCASFWERYAKTCEAYGSSSWDLADITEGFGHVRAKTSEMFIPQMLNYQMIDGVSFKKGCYIGQEVVARMQYLGKLKRHMRRGLMATKEAPAPGTALISEESTQSVGNIVLGAMLDEAHCEILAVITDKFSASKTLTSQDNSAKIIRWLPLPYAIPK